MTAYAEMLAAVKDYYGLQDQGVTLPLKVSLLLAVASSQAMVPH